MAAGAIAIDHSAWRPRHNPWLIAFVVTLATFMEVLDTSVANIALPHIAGSFGASINEATWVLTSYLVSNGIVLPISAWLATRFGRKRYYMSCVALVRGQQLSLRVGAHAWNAGFFSGGARHRRRRIAAERAVDPGGHVYPGAAGHGIFDLRHGGGAGAGDRSYDRRMDHRQL